MYTETPESRIRKTNRIATDLDLSPAEASMVYQHLRDAIESPYSTKPATGGLFQKYPWLQSISWKTCSEATESTETTITVWVNGFTWAELSRRPELVNWFRESGPVWIGLLPVIDELDRPAWRESQPDLVFTAWRGGCLEIGKGIPW